MADPFAASARSRTAAATTQSGASHPPCSDLSQPLFPREAADGYTGCVTFELWSKASRSIVGAFDSETQALAAVRDALTRNGRAYAEELAVIREDSRGRSKLIAEGAQLVERAVIASRPRSQQLTA